MVESSAEPQSEQEAPPKRSFWEFCKDVYALALSKFEKLQDLGETNFDLACEMAARNESRDAIFRFKMALWFAPQMNKVHYHLGCCYVAEGERELAIQHLQKAIAANENAQNAAFMLSTLDPSLLPPELIPKRMPVQLAQEYFNSIAEFYNTMQAEGNYQGHMHVGNAVITRTDESRLDYDMLDLGCGTGLVGQVLRQRVNSITGVDVSRLMGDIASDLRKNDVRVYDDVLHHDLYDYVPAMGEDRFDIITMCDVLPYLGAVDALFAPITKALRDKGLFVFTYDAYSAEQAFGMMPETGKFGYGDGLIRGLLAQAKLEVLSLETVQLYPEYQTRLVVARKGA